MVDRLAARLKQDGSDLDGWVRLVRSYKVLGEPEKARAAAADARQALAGDPAKLQQLDAALKSLDADNAATAVPAPGPTAAQVVAAADQPPEQQAAMIQSMVDRLAARLKQDGSDLDGWVRLARSYKVLGEPEKARAAAADARQALAGDPARLQQLDAALKSLDADNAATAVTAPGPTAAQVAAAGAPQDHGPGATMQTVVERLAKRLKSSGSDLEGWLTLVRSYENFLEKRTKRRKLSVKLAVRSQMNQISWNSSIRRLRTSKSANNRSHATLDLPPKGASPSQMQTAIPGSRRSLCIPPSGMGCPVWSIVLGTLEYPAPNDVAQTTRQRFMSKRHSNFCPAVDEYNKIAAIRLARDHHRSELGTFHQSVITRQIEAAGIVTFTAGLMTRYAISLENGDDVFGEAYLTLLRAGALKRRHKRCSGQ